MCGPKRPKRRRVGLRPVALALSASQNTGYTVLLRTQTAPSIEMAFANNAQTNLVLAQMSKLQRKQLDKDGDGQYSAEELKAYGISMT